MTSRRLLDLLLKSNVTVHYVRLVGAALKARVEAHGESFLLTIRRQKDVERVLDAASQARREARRNADVRVDRDAELTRCSVHEAPLVEIKAQP